MCNWIFIDTENELRIPGHKLDLFLVREYIRIKVSFKYFPSITASPVRATATHAAT